MSKKGGFTLIELLVVTSIIALLSSVVMASLNEARDKGRIARSLQFASQMSRAVGDSAVGIWDFNEGSGTAVGDRSGFGHDGVLNTSGWSASTPSGTGYSGNFSSSRYVLASSFPNYTDQITVSAWFRSTATGERTVIGKYDNVLDDRSWTIYFDSSDRLVINISGDGTFTTSTAKSYRVIGSYRDGNWHHVAFTFSQNTLKIYVDGTEASLNIVQNPVMNSIYASASPLLIGSRMAGGTPNYYFSGQIDEVRIFNKALTAKEMGAVYAAGASRLLAAE